MPGKRSCIVLPSFAAARPVSTGIIALHLCERSRWTAGSPPGVAGCESQEGKVALGKQSAFWHAGKSSVAAAVSGDRARVDRGSFLTSVVRCNDSGARDGDVCYAGTPAPNRPSGRRVRDNPRSGVTSPAGGDGCESLSAAAVVTEKDGDSAQRSAWISIGADGRPSRRLSNRDVASPDRITERIRSDWPSHARPGIAAAAFLCRLAVAW